MLRYVLFDLSLFPDEDERASSQKRILSLLQALTYCNQLYLREHPNTPLMYRSGIRYKMPQQFERADVPEIAAVRKFLEDKNASSDVMSAFSALDKMCGGGETFRDIPRIIENGGGDCDNVASWRAAELRELGIAARPYITWRKRPDGGTTYHVIVQWPDGSSEDPSLLLGMGGDGRKKEREAEERKLAERTADLLQGKHDTIFGARGPIRPVWQPQHGTTVFGQLPSDFGKGLQYTIPFQTDDSYEDWSPTRPSAYYANPQYKGGLVQDTPFFNTRLRDPDDIEDRLDRFEAIALLESGGGSDAIELSDVGRGEIPSEREDIDGECKSYFERRKASRDV